MRLDTDPRQFQEANRQLYHQMRNNPSVMARTASHAIKTIIRLGVEAAQSVEAASDEYVRKEEMSDRPIIFEGLDDLISRSLLLADSNDWIYVNFDDLQRDAYDCRYFYLPEEWIDNLPSDRIYIDDEGLEMPVTVQELNLRGWRLAGDIAFTISEELNADDVKSAVVKRLQKWEDVQPSWRQRPR